MKRVHKKYVVPMVGVVVLAVIVLFLTTVSSVRTPKSCSNCAQYNEPLLSPSGKYTLTLGTKVAGVQDEYSVAIVIDTRTQTEQALPYSEKMNRSKTYFIWDNNENIWSYNADLGTYVYTNQGSEWVKRQVSTYEEAGMCPPEELIQIMFEGKETFTQCM